MNQAIFTTTMYNNNYGTLVALVSAVFWSDYRICQEVPVCLKLCTLSQPVRLLFMTFFKFHFWCDFNRFFHVPRCFLHISKQNVVSIYYLNIVNFVFILIEFFGNSYSEFWIFRPVHGDFSMFVKGIRFESFSLML